jgi:diguanylate cyclase (GGDEF)-like protein/PAS domain S-box-containing protein
MDVPSSRVSRNPQSSLRTLVVQREGAARRELVELLQARGHRVAVCESHAAGLAEHRREPFGIVLLEDTGQPLPELAAAYESYRTQGGATAPLLLGVASGPDADRALAALGAGADEVLTLAALPGVVALRLDVAERRARRRSERRAQHTRLRQLEKAFETMQLGVTITDLERRIVYTNAADAHMHGWEPSELLGRDARVFAPPGNGREMPRATVLSITRWKRESVNVRKDGSVFPVQVTSDLVRDDAGVPMGIVSCCEDISERRAAAEALRESEERYALAASGARDGLWDWDLRRDRVYYSGRWGEILGLAPGEIGDRPDTWLDRVHPADRALVQEELSRHLRGESAHFESSHRVQHRDGAHRWVLVRGVAVRDEKGGAYRMAGSLSDLSGGGAHDLLTGLPSRAFFMGRLTTAVEHAARLGEGRFALLVIDVDRFRLVNDSLGPLAGDQLLLGVVDRIERSLREGGGGGEPQATLARAGGDEFLVLLEGVRDATDAIRLAERIREALQAPIRVGDRDAFTTVSVGIAVSGAAYERAEEMVRDAEVALHRAQAAGNARYEVFDQGMHERAMARLRVESELRRALAEGELRVHYQPIVELAGGKTRRLEALVRWRHPEEGLLLPERFIPLAEESDLVLDIDRWVLRSVCRQLSSLRAEAGIRMPVNVNLSGRHFSRLDLVGWVREALEASGLEPAALELEVTEGILMQNPEMAQRVLGELKALGVQLCLDDFGTGYSSLSYLHQFPIDVLKVDRSFVAGMLDHGKGRIVETIVRLARQLGIGVVAEGVESPAQRDRLRAIGCELAQGYLFARPMPWEQARELLGPS